MRLHGNPLSPFVRKVCVLAIESGQGDDLEIVPRTHTPVAPDPDLNAVNPLGKIPCLVTDDGLALYDSRVIAEYLDSRHGGTPLFPPAGAARWAALRLQALGDGIMDAGVLARYEQAVRPEDKQWAAWADNQQEKFRRSLDWLESAVPSLGDRVDIGTIAVACGLGYLDFRFPDEGWRSHRPELAAWFESFASRPSMLATAPR